MRLSETFIWSKSTLLLSPDLGSRKVTLGAGTCFAIVKFYRKNHKNGFREIPIGGKVVSVSQAYFLW